MTTPNDRAMRKAADQVAIDRMGHELNEAQARRQRLAAQVFATKQAVLRAQVLAKNADLQYQEAKAELERRSRELQQLEARLNEGLQMEEGIRLRLERYKTGGVL